MSEEITAMVGIRVSAAELKEIDPREIGRLQAQPPRDEVEGQGGSLVYVACPVCGCMGVYSRREHCYRYNTYDCCGAAFRV
jgi:hypothetical protein